MTDYGRYESAIRAVMGSDRGYPKAPDPLLVVQDTREQYEPRFSERVEVTRAALPYGDYSCVGLTSKVALEVKWSLSDLIACVTSDRDRFDNMLRGLCGYQIRALIVADSEANVWRGAYVSKVSPLSIMRSVWSWQQDYGLPVVWGESTMGATIAIEWWLGRAAAKLGGADDQA